jgi:hypothetical protein
MKDKIPWLCFLSVKLLAVIVLASRAAHKNQHSDVASYIIVCKMQVEKRFLWL